LGGHGRDLCASAGLKVFWFFSSEKNAFLNNIDNPSEISKQKSKGRGLPGSGPAHVCSDISYKYYYLTGKIFRVCTKAGQLRAEMVYIRKNFYDFFTARFLVSRWIAMRGQAHATGENRHENGDRHHQTLQAR
jgi:hypothetical protein